MRTYDNLIEIDTRIQSVVHQLGADEIAKKVWWMWNKRFTATLADAAYPEMCIRLSAKAWPLMSIQARRETIDHEVCHLVDAYQIGDYPDIHHGPSWQALMSKLGYRHPDRYLAVDVSRIAACKRIRVYCGCDAKYIPVQLAGRIRNGGAVRCSRCRDLMFIPE